MPLRIVHYNDPILRKKGARITQFDGALIELSQEMIALMHELHGIGLAAQQVGIAQQICVIDLRPTDVDYTWELDGAKPPLELIMPMVIINPVIKVQRGTDDYIYEEGCLSFPEIRGDVIRPDAITVEFQDERGIAHRLVCDGLFSRCIQHEADHLNGTLFIDRMEKKVRAKIEKPIKELDQRTREAASDAV